VALLRRLRLRAGRVNGAMGIGPLDFQKKFRPEVLARSGSRLFAKKSAWKIRFCR
jgi:hypothetical protein